MVKELIDETSAVWREAIIRENFLPMNASAILGIPLCAQAMDDFWSWSHEKKESLLFALLT